MKGYIFLCNEETCDECFEKNLFGTGSKFCEIFKNIKIGEDLIFLFHRDKNLLYGIWKAVSKVEKWKDPKAWGGNYPCQVEVKLMTNDYLYIDGETLEKQFGIRFNQIIIDEGKLHYILDYLARKYNMEINKIETYKKLEKFRSINEKFYRAKDGHIVRSKSEVIIDNWLYDNNIKHSYEPLITEIPENLRPDWLVEGKNGNKCYIEFWGLEGLDSYNKYVQRKLEIYMKYKLPLIEIREKDLKNLDFYLKNELRKKGII